MLKDTCTLITGATGGLGREIASELAKNGRDLFLVSKETARLEKLKNSLQQEFGVGIEYAAVDFSSDESTEHLCHQLKSYSSLKFDGIVFIYPRIPQTKDCFPSSERWRELFDLSFIRPLQVFKTGTDFMIQKGKVVLISGISAVQAFPQFAVSNVIRSAWLAEAKTAALVLAPNIHVNTLSLGGTLTEAFCTEMMASRANGREYDQVVREESSTIPLGKYNTPDNVAIVVNSLLSSMTDHITGSNIICDGGFIKSY